MKTKSIISAILQILIAAITAAITAFGLSSCSTTRASITRPADSSSTTITISTNNPVSANPAVSLDVPLNLNPKQSY